MSQPATTARAKGSLFTDNKTFLMVVMALLLIIAGPLFGPIPFLLATTMDVRAATGWQVALFLIGFGVVFGIVVAWMRRNQRTFADLG